MRLKYDLEGSPNYIAWKDKMEAMLEDNGLNELIDSDIPQPLVKNSQLPHAWRKNVAKARRIMLEGVRDYIVSNLHGKEPPYAIWKALTYLFQNKNDHRKTTLKEKLRKIKMEKGDTIPKYLKNITQCRDELGGVGVTVVEDNMVSLILLGLPKI